MTIVPVSNAILLIITLAVSRLIHRILHARRSGVPCAHWSSAISSLWILNVRFNSREICTIHEAHQRLGPVIRLAPNEISVNCVKGGIQTIYAGGFEKHEWYSNLFDNYNG
jgi:hypothetical protein